jgi:hypothetical protein
MILPAINEEQFLELVRKAPTIAFQWVKYGWAVAAEGEAYYAPVSHPGGGNLTGFREKLGEAFIVRMETPVLRTLRPTAQPIPSAAFISYLGSAFTGDFDEDFKKVPGDQRAVVEFQTGVVIQAIEEHDRPDLKEATINAKRDLLDDVVDVIIEHAEAARELCEVGEEWQPGRFRFHLLQCSTALQTALKMLLSP